MYVVMTTVVVQPDSIDALAQLFDATNHALVAQHEDWLAAYFTADRETNTVTVLAHWRQAESYEALRTSEEFQQIMGQFAPRFAGPPVVAVHEVLVEMTA